MGAAWAAASDAYAVRQFEQVFERGVVDGGDAVDTEADAEED